MKTNELFGATEYLFSEMQAITQMMSKQDFLGYNLVWEEQTLDPTEKLTELFRSQVFAEAIRELEKIKTDEADFFRNGLLLTKRGVDFEYENSDKMQTLSDKDRLQFISNHLIQEDGYSALFTASVSGFPIQTSEIYNEFLMKEIKKVPPYVQTEDSIKHSLTVEKICDIYSSMGLDMSLVLMKPKLVSDDNSPLGGTAYRWIENGKLQLGLIYTKDPTNPYLSITESYILLHELGHLLHWFLVREVPNRYFSATSGAWQESVPDAFALIVLEMLEEQEAIVLKQFYNNQMYHRFADALLCNGSNLLKRNDDIERGCIEYAASSASAIENVMSLPLSGIITEKILRIFRQSGLDTVKGLIRNTHGLALHNFINTTIRERLAESET